MSAPLPLHPDPTTLPPPHGPDHDCLECGRMRRSIGHVPLDQLPVVPSVLLMPEWRQAATMEVTP